MASNEESLNRVSSRIQAGNITLMKSGKTTKPNFMRPLKDNYKQHKQTTFSGKGWTQYHLQLGKSSNRRATRTSTKT